MRDRLRRHFRSLVCALACVGVLGSRVSTAQPMIDAVLSDAQLVTHNGCAILKVNFNVRIRYAHHLPLDHGSELQIAVNAIDRDQFIAMQLLKREAVRPPGGRTAAIMAHRLRNASGDRLGAQHPFRAPGVLPGGAERRHAEHHRRDLGRQGRPPPASRNFPPMRPASTGAVAHAAGRQAASRPMARPPGKISDADLRIAAAAMDEARAALEKKNFNGAIALLTKVLRYPENKYSAEAQELLGLARQRNGQPDAARAAYEDYLRRYPRGEGAERVQQRLAGTRHRLRRAGREAAHARGRSGRRRSAASSSRPARPPGRSPAACRSSTSATTASRSRATPARRRIRTRRRMRTRCIRTRC